MPAGKGISQLTQVTTVTDGDLFLITDDSTGASRRVSWPNVEASINNITLADNTTGAFTFAEGANNYITIDTTDGSEKTIFHQDIQVNQTLSLGASGSQFFAFNEDTIKVKYANWYSSNTRQYGQGQLWYELWFAAIDDTGGAANRRIGFYLDAPSHGASDTAGGSGQHPNNDRMHIDLDGVYIADDLEVNGDIILNPSSSQTPANNGELVVEATNNTTLTFKLKGSDGVVRTGTLTLS